MEWNGPTDRGMVRSNTDTDRAGEADNHPDCQILNMLFACLLDVERQRRHSHVTTLSVAHCRADKARHSVARRIRFAHHNLLTRTN